MGADNSKEEVKKLDAMTEWENSLGFKGRSFFSLISDFNSKTLLEGNEIQISKFENFLKKHWEYDVTVNKIMDLINFDIFKIKSKIDCKNVKLLFFLLCPANKIVNSYDKVDFLFNLLDEDENEGDSTLKRDDVELLLGSIFDIVCNCIPTSFFRTNREEYIENKEELMLIKNYISEVNLKFFDDFFQGKPEVSYQELNDRFEKNKMFMTSRYIIDIAIRTVKDKKPTPTE